MTMGAQPEYPPVEKSQRQIVLELMDRRDLGVGDILTYDELSDALGFDVRRNRSAIYAAFNEWCSDHHRALTPVIGQGYRVVDAPEHETLARKHHSRARKQLRRATKTIVDTDRTRLSPQDQARFDAMETRISRQRDMLRRFDARVEKVEKEGRKTRRSVAETQERLAKLEDLLRQHGITDGDS